MQKDSDKPLGAERHLLAGAIAGRKHISKYCNLSATLLVKHFMPKRNSDQFVKIY